MTPEDVQRRVDGIAAMAGDPEGAHSHEDQLHQAVLAAIRDGSCSEPTKCAEIALSTLNLDFDRWYA